MLLYLFVSFRLLLLLVYQPYLLNGVERGVSVFGDFEHYYNLAVLSDHQQLPYRDYWLEFPPVFPIISITVYSLTGSAGGFTAYATLFGLVMIAFDTANLLLIRRIGTQLHGETTGIALAWIYALLAVPLVFSFWTFEPIVACSILLVTSWLIRGRDLPSAAAIAFGTLTKLFPLILVAVAWRFRSLQQALRYTGLAAVLTAAGLLVMLLIAGPFGLPSLMVQFNKASYETVWALLDHNYTTGNFGPVSDHFDPAKAYILLGNPAVIPWWLRGAFFGVIGLFVYIRTRRRDAKGIVAFVAITITLFFLWSQGWSPQWLMTLVVLILLNFPMRGGVLVCLMLAFLSFGEYPLLFARTGDTGGVISPAQLPVFTVLVLARTLILTGFAVALYRRLRITEPSHD